MSIPKKIFFIWLGGEIPSEIQKRVNDLSKKFPDYDVKILNESNFDVNKHKYSKIAYDNKKYAFVSDYLRIKVLYEEGGIYLDTDMLNVAPFEQLLENYSLVLAFEHRKLISTGIIACEKGDLFMKEILDYYEAYDNLKIKKMKYLINNELITYLCKKKGLTLKGKQQNLEKKIIVYPHSYFSWSKKNTNSVFLHLHALSWTSSFKASLMKWSLDKIQRSEIIARITFLYQIIYFYKIKKLEKNLFNNMKNETNKKK